LRHFLIKHFKLTHTIPVYNFAPRLEKGFFFCSAGSERIAVTTEGHIWGCQLFADYFNRKENTRDYSKYHFGHFETYKSDLQNINSRILPNYKKLSMDNFKTENRDCFLCPDIEYCLVCPVNAAFFSRSIGKIPDYFCRIQKIKINQKKLFWNFLKKKAPAIFQNED